MIVNPPENYSMVNPSYTSYQDMLSKFEELYSSIRRLPPMPQEISVHPADMEIFVSIFRKIMPDALVGRTMPLISIPVRFDIDVPQGNVRILTEGEIKEYPLQEQ